MNTNWRNDQNLSGLTWRFPVDDHAFYIVFTLVLIAEVTVTYHVTNSSISFDFKSSDYLNKIFGNKLSRLGFIVIAVWRIYFFKLLPMGQTEQV